MNYQHHELRYYNEYLSLTITIAKSLKEDSNMVLEQLFTWATISYQLLSHFANH